jgi:hypothetical protein
MAKETWLERARNLQYKIETWHHTRKEQKEIRYRKWLVNPTRRGKTIILPTMY